MLLEGRVIWITGASRGIGRATALRCAREGAKLALAARDVEHLSETAEGVVEAGGEEPLLLGYDVADDGAVKSAALQIKKELGGLFGVVNNAGVLNDSLLGMIQPADIQATFDTNLTGVILHMQLAARLIRGDGGGSIVNVSSIIGRVGNAGQTVYGASKAGVIGATQSAAKELAPRGIRVNAVAPGYIETDMIKHLSEEVHQERLDSIALGRVGTGDDIAGAVVFLLSDLSAYVTGQVLGVDGGMVI